MALVFKIPIILFTLYCIAVILTINIAGYGLTNAVNGRWQDVNIKGRSVNIASIEVPYWDSPLPEGYSSNDWTFYFFLNGVCAKTTYFITEDAATFCLFHRIGHTFDFYDVLRRSDPNTMSWIIDKEINAGELVNITFPTPTVQHVSPNRINTVAPFAEYFISVVLAFFALVLYGVEHLPMKVRPSRIPKLIVPIFAGVSLVFIFAASVTVTVAARKIFHKLPLYSPYIGEVKIGSTLLGLTWSAALAMILSTVLVLIERRLSLVTRKAGTPVLVTPYTSNFDQQRSVEMPPFPPSRINFDPAELEDGTLPPSYTDSTADLTKHDDVKDAYREIDSKSTEDAKHAEQWR